MRIMHTLPLCHNFSYLMLLLPPFTISSAMEMSVYYLLAPAFRLVEYNMLSMRKCRIHVGVCQVKFKAYYEHERGRALSLL